MFVRVSILMALGCSIGVIALAGPVELASQAKAVLDAGNNVLAASLFQQIMTEFPSSPQAPEATLKRAYLRIRLGEAQPEELFARVVSMYPTSGQAGNAMKRLAYYRERAGQVDEAQQLFFQAGTNDHLSPTEKAECLVHHAYLDISKYFAAGLPDKPKCDGTSAVPDDRKAEAASRLEAARVKLSSAVQTLRGDGATAPYAAFAQAGIGETYILEQRWVEGEAAYRAGLTDYQGLPRSLQALLHHGLGACLSRQGLTEDALAELTSAIADAEIGGQVAGADIPLQKVLADAACVKGMLLMGQHKSEEAADLLDDMLTRLTKDGIPTGDTREWIARLAGWNVIALNHAQRPVDRDAALSDLLRSFEGTDAARQAASWARQYGWGAG